MLETLKIHSELYQESGNQAGSGVIAQLGRPKMSQLAMLIRESVQNSWDARINSDDSVLYGIDYWRASSDQMDVLRENVFNDRPAGGLELDSMSGTRSVPMMVIYDRGTQGLTGPVRANVLPRPGERPNFNNLLRNIGSAQQQEFSGGTYGYGKAALFRSSRISSIVVHSTCIVDGARQSRLIGMALGKQFDRSGVLFTGRHWWGVKEDILLGAIADPLIGHQADDLASALGMPEFGPEETGTSILIVDPEFNPVNLPDAVTNVLLWNFWPKMIESAESAPMQFRFDMNGENIEIQDPKDVRYLRPFIDSLEIVNRVENDPGFQSLPTQIFPISSGRPRRRLGTLAITPIRDIDVPDDDDDEELGTIPVETPLRYVALMRRAELVVRYLPGPTHDQEGLHYGGVFKTDAGVDGAFASSEGPAHDDWSPNSLELGPDRTAVNVGLREIRSAIREFAQPGGRSIESDGSGPALGSLSESFSDLLPGEEGEALGGKSLTGSSGGGSTGGGTPRIKRAQIKTVGEGTLMSVDGKPVLRVGFEIVRGESESVLTVSATAVASDDETSRVPRGTATPAGMDDPKVLGWIDPEGTPISGSNAILIEDDGAGEWSVVIEVTDSSAVRVDVNVKEED